MKGTVVRFTCQWTNLSHIRLISKMELVKDGISFYQWWRLWLASYAFTASLNQAGRYRCKGTIGAASQYSSPFFLVVGSKYGYSIFHDFRGLCHKVSYHSIAGSCYRFYFTSKIKITNKNFKMPWSVHFQQESIKIGKLFQRMCQISVRLKQHCWPVKWPPLQ